MAKVIQITDTHIVPEGQLAYGKVDTAVALAETVATVNRMLPQIGPVDMIIVTGDLTDFGTDGEYRRFRQIMAPLQVPYRAVPGNHDDREAMRVAFADQEWMPSSGPIDWVIDLGDFVLVGLDTSIPNAPNGRLAGDSLDFLRRQMGRFSPKPFLVGIHHPPFATGIIAMDKQNLHGSEALREVLDGHAGEVNLLCGHVHRSVTTRFGRAICQIAPGTSHAVTLEQRQGATNTLTIEPGGFLLHEWRAGLVSHSIPVGEYMGPYPFYS